MQLRLTRPADLSPAERELWLQIQQANPALESPFFRPEYHQAVATVRDDVEVAVLERHGASVGFFPFQRTSPRVARPVGGGFSDYQGVIVPAGLEWSPSELLRGCGLSAWHFDHLVAAQTPLAPFHQVHDCSPFLDLSEGFDAYRLARRRGGTDEIDQTLRKMRKLERERGELRFEQHSADSAVLEQLVAWKSEQCERTGVPNGLAVPWARAMLERLLERRDTGFATDLAALYVQDRLAAVHLGMRSNQVFHSWIVAYDRELSKYSPGLILLVRMLQTLAEQGVTRFDLGKGDMPYKRSFRSGAVPLAEGSVDLRPVRRAMWRYWRATTQAVRSSPLRQVARVPWRGMRYLRQRFAFR